jgi:2-phospho-L-lactate guanylyltransferase
MAPRAYWKGSLKLSLVSCPVVLYPASTSVEKTRFHMINKETGNRLKQQMIDAETGDVVESDQKVRGYELKKGQYVEIEKEELEAVQIESNHTIEIDSFVPRDEIDKRYYNHPYYIAPDGKAAVDAFAVIRDAMKDEERVALAARLLRRVLGAIGQARLGETVVITPDPDLAEIVAAEGGRLIVQHGMGLNEGLEEARKTLASEGATSMAVLHGDLPDLDPDDIRALIDALPDEGVAIAPDTRGIGTNGLALRPIEVIPFRFGSGSFIAHQEEAAMHGVEARIVNRHGLRFDVDTPEDLERWLSRGDEVQLNPA